MPDFLPASRDTSIRFSVSGSSILVSVDTQWVERDSACLDDCMASFRRARRSPPQNLVNLLAHFVLVDISISSPVGILKSMMGRRMNAFQPPNEIADDEEDKAAF